MREMKSNEFFKELLGIALPWEVEKVDLNMNQSEVKIHLSVREGWKWRDSEGKEASIHDWKVREFRALDTGHCETIVIAKVPRLIREDGKTEMASVPWAGKGSRYTWRFECWAIEVMLACKTLSDACKLLGIHWDAAQRIMERAVERGMERRSLEHLKYLGMDEKSYLRGHQYITLLNDLENGVVLEVARGRDADSVTELVSSIPWEVREKIKAFSIDMWKPFINGIEKYFPHAKIVFDRFHISKHLNEGIDAVRKQENRELLKEGDESLKGSKYIWLTRKENMDELTRDTFERMLKCTLKVARAWSIKELFDEIWSLSSMKQAREFFTRWYGRTCRSQLKPMIKVAQMLKRHVEGIVSSIRHPITNAKSEAINTNIQSLKAAARGLPNFENYRIRILFFCGKLDLIP